jgi:hypothetical protein
LPGSVKAIEERPPEPKLEAIAAPAPAVAVAKEPAANLFAETSRVAAIAAGAPAVQTGVEVKAGDKVGVTQDIPTQQGAGMTTKGEVATQGAEVKQNPERQASGPVFTFGAGASAPTAVPSTVGAASAASLVPEHPATSAFGIATGPTASAPTFAFGAASAPAASTTAPAAAASQASQGISAAPSFTFGASGGATAQQTFTFGAAPQGAAPGPTPAQQPGIGFGGFSSGGVGAAPSQGTSSGATRRTVRARRTGRR